MCIAHKFKHARVRGAGSNGTNSPMTYILHHHATVAVVYVDLYAKNLLNIVEAVHPAGSC